MKPKPCNPLCDACGREFPEEEIAECSDCDAVACDECRGDRCCKMAESDEQPTRDFGHLALDEEKK